MGTYLVGAAYDLIGLRPLFLASSAICILAILASLRIPGVRLDQEKGAAAG